MKRKTILIGAIPWVGIFLLLSWHVWGWWEARTARQAILGDLPLGVRGMIDNLRVYHSSAARKVYVFDDVFDGREVCVFESGALMILIRRRPSDPQYMYVSLFTGRHGERDIVHVGTVKGRSFPSFVTYIPQTGPDQGKILGDYDLDGVFEIKR